MTVITWNIDCKAAGVGGSAAAILKHLQDVCSDTPVKTMVALREVGQESLDTILRSRWVQQHFRASNIQPPPAQLMERQIQNLHYERPAYKALPLGRPTLEDILVDEPGQQLGFTATMTEMASTRSFHVMLISADVPIQRSFRIPLARGNDGLVADFCSLGSSHEDDVVRVCTTDLYDVSRVVGRRGSKQDCDSEVILALCERGSSVGYNIVGSIVTGDTDPHAVHEPKRPSTNADETYLRDVWLDGPPEVIPKFKPGQRDFSDGLARGNTWGYQHSFKKRNGRRAERILSAGAWKAVRLCEGEQLTRGLRRLGVGAKTEVKAFKYVSTEEFYGPGGMHSMKSVVPQVSFRDKD
ncbi:unnamed protein product [Zymoseptoria tritici ST99CH_3D1]|nr:unnamed protein product [Zymoseptoria tritici ST99CH_3D1]